MRILSLVVMAALMTATPWADAKGTSSGSSSSGSGSSYGRGGGGAGSQGVQGTITGVGSSGFVITADAPKTEGKSDDKPKMWQVRCTVTTKFVADGKDVGPSVIKVGLHVGVIGGPSSQYELMATTVNIGTGKG